MKRFDAAVILTGVAHALAWVVGFWLTFGPVYPGESVTAIIPGEGGGESTRTTATFIEVNGLSVLPILLAPVALTGVALLAVLVTHSGQVRRKALLWVSAVLLLGFSGLASFSMGLLYLPAALALVFSAILGSFSRGAETGVG